jgi:RNA polymerase sigma factor (TIGR02999 family)
VISALTRRSFSSVVPPGGAMDSVREDVTRWLAEVGRGNQAAVEKLVPLLYSELRRLAVHYLRRERPNHTLQATALVHEAYLRLVDQKQVKWKNRGHFFAVAAQQMRRILVDYSRRRQAVKRGGAQPALTEEIALVPDDRTGEIVMLDEALVKLAALDPRHGRVVELRFFAGLSIEETAEVLGISAATVKREWALAKAWLAREMGKGSAASV